MAKQIPELQNAINTRDYKKIALISHSIKGSSGNFRMESLQEKTAEMERMAKDEETTYDYESVFDIVKEMVAKIKIT